MVKGISKQVIVVQSQDKKLFEQAIFILSDEAVRGKGVTDDMLLKEAKQLIHRSAVTPKTRKWLYSLGLWAAGALATGALWLIVAIL